MSTASAALGGQTAKAVTLFSSDETEFLKRIESFIGEKIERRKLEGFAYRTEPVLDEPALFETSSVVWYESTRK